MRKKLPKILIKKTFVEEKSEGNKEKLSDLRKNWLLFTV